MKFLTMTEDPWNPERYQRFRNERRQPFFDLLEFIEAQPQMRVVDLGCGTGELTRVLHRKLQAKETVGVDSSDAMLSQSSAFVEKSLTFRKGDIVEFQAQGDLDLIFSNAALQWVPEHEGLLARMASALTARGQLAIQVPAHHGSVFRLVASQIAEEPPFKEALGGFRLQNWVLSAEEYARLLHKLGFREQNVRLQVYPHVLVSREDTVEWFKGTLLTAFERHLSKDLYTRFVEQYRARLMTKLEDTRPYFFPFSRILLYARR